MQTLADRNDSSADVVIFQRFLIYSSLVLMGAIGAVALLTVASRDWNDVVRAAAFVVLAFGVFGVIRWIAQRYYGSQRANTIVSLVVIACTAIVLALWEIITEAQDAL